ncbi:hypothetical protein COC46_01370 [Bacillus sp. AFS041924]|nr:hypothetical protein COC46_01370 [Bacillus sp. AFS041924]
MFIKGFAVTATIEILQFFLQIGQFDIDDIILNSIGIILGYSFLWLLINNPLMTKWKFTKRNFN